MSNEYIPIKSGTASYHTFNGRRSVIGSPHADVLVSTENEFSDFLKKSVAELNNAGFDLITPVFNTSILNTSLSKSIVAFGSSPLQSSLGWSTMRLSVAHATDEQLITIEFDKLTGDIIGWHYQTESTTTLEKKFSWPQLTSLASPLTNENLNSETAIFEFPLVLPRASMEPITSFENADLANVFKMNPHTNFNLAGKFKENVDKVVAVFSLKKIDALAGQALLKAIRFVDIQIKPREVLQRVDATLTLPDVTKEELSSMSGKSVLLLVHGIISSTEGAFKDLISSAEFEELSALYEGRIIAYDHWTLSKSTFENAQSLANELPENCTLDIVCHSRGAGVVRALLELPRLQTLLLDHQVNVHKVIFVAGACEGSPLAKKETVDRLFKIFAAAGKIVKGPAILSNIVITSLIKLLLRGVQELPGTDSMDPNGAAIRELAISKSTLAKQYGYIRANSDFTNTGVNLVDELTIDRLVFSNWANDVVVPFAGAGKNSNYLNAAPLVKVDLLAKGTPSITQSDIWHITFFKSQEVRVRIREDLSEKILE